VIEDAALFHAASPVSELERRPWGEADEIDPIRPEPADTSWQQRESRGEGELFVPVNVEAIQVLIGDSRIGTDIDDIDPRHGRLQVPDGLRNNSARNHRLSESHLVSDEKSVRGIIVQEHPVEYVLHRPSLKVLEAIEDWFHRKPVIHCRTSFRTAA
jgi:hypothetical protein